ncbi:MAG: hypothetical protein R3300_22595, partial [Candidatus Promineifilaceae bacterium]|nr:hypothetical protein [Candidatus Promineifilaceae bacterium]
RWAHFVEASQSLCLFSLFRSRHRDGMALFDMTLPASRDRTRVHTYLLAGRLLLARQLGQRDDALANVPALRARLATTTKPADQAYCRLMLGQAIGLDPARGGEALQMLNGAERYYHEVGEPFYNALASWRKAAVYAVDDRRQDMLAVWQRALELARSAGDRYVASWMLHNLGTVTFQWEGPTESAERLLLEAVNGSKELGTKALRANSLAGLSFVVAGRHDDPGRAMPLLEQAIAVADAQDVPYIQAQLLAQQALYRLGQKHYQACLELTEEVLSLAEPGSFTWANAWAIRGTVWLTKDDFNRALASMRRVLQAWVTDPRLAILDQYLPYVGLLLAHGGRDRLATEVLACSRACHKLVLTLELDHQLPQLQRQLEQKLGPEAFVAAWERGRSLGPLALAERALAALESGVSGPASH